MRDPEVPYMVMDEMPTRHTPAVLLDLVRERQRQIEKWGHNTTTPYGTGPGVQWLPNVIVAGAPEAVDYERQRLYGARTVPLSAIQVEKVLRDDYNAHQAQHGTKGLTWMHFLREEVAEAFQEDDPSKLYAELIQVAAVAVSWCEKLIAREAAR